MIITYWKPKNRKMIIVYQRAGYRKRYAQRSASRWYRPKFAGHPFDLCYILVWQLVGIMLHLGSLIFNLGFDPGFRVQKRRRQLNHLRMAGPHRLIN